MNAESNKSLIKVAAGVEYLGQNYCGWQSQPDQPSVQGCIETALSKVANRKIEIVCAGRTDTGVNASGQVIHFYAPADRTEKGWIRGTNSFLPDDIAIVWAKIVPDDFHARYSATARRYRYYIYNFRYESAIHPRMTWEYRPLDATLMNAEAQVLVGKHDFSSFRASECQAVSPMRTIERISVIRKGEYLVVEVVANAFLHNMVRNIVGSLILVGAKQRNVGWLYQVLEARDRTVAGTKSKADGLYLDHVFYPQHFELPEKPRNYLQQLAEI
jgi:tRNA pseudouridine38-40 synthase